MKRIDILKNSLKNKNKLLDDKFEVHFATVKQANGQPLNDKRNGMATIQKWDRQSESIRNLKDSIKKTEDAIEHEESKISETEYVYKSLPECIKKLIKSKTLKQWRKHPHILFVDGVDKARIIWNQKKSRVEHNYTKAITDKDQWKKFAKIFNNLQNLTA